MRSTRLRSAALVVAAQLLTLAGPAASSSASLPGGLGDPGLRAGDTTPPQVLLAPDREPDGAAGWYTAPVSVTVSVTDDLPSGGGVASVAYELSGASTGSGTLPPSGGTVPVSREGATTVTVTATDAAGNAGSATAELRVDLRSPAVDLNGLSDDVLLRQGAVQPLMYACFDTGSGVAACDAPLARGDLLPTGVLGDFEVSVTARDIAGRVLTRTLRYLVSDRLHFASEAGLTGTPRVGGTLTMVPAVARERQLGSLPCQWRRDGQPLPDQFFPAYEVVRADQGHRISLVCVASFPGFDTERSVSAPVTIPRETTPEGTVRDVHLQYTELRVGETLALTYDVVGDLAATPTYAWTRDGLPIAGADGREYVLRPEDHGHRVAGVVRIAPAGRDPRDFPSEERLVDRLRIVTLTAPPSVSGRPVVGGTLTAGVPQAQVSGPSAPTAYDTAVTWLRDGVSVGAGTTYRPRAADLGHRLTARVELSGPGYETATADSGATEQVAPARGSIVVQAQARGRGVVRLAVDVRAAGLAPDGVLLVRLGRELVGRARVRGGAALLRLTGQDRGRARYRLSFAGPGVVAAPVTARVEVR